MRSCCWSSQLAVIGFFIGSMVLSVSVFANESPPSQEFWEYMVDFDDGSGEVLDPLEYEQLSDMKKDLEKDEDAGAKDKDTLEKDEHDESEEKFDNPNVRNVDMTCYAKNYAKTCSMVKGVDL